AERRKLNFAHKASFKVVNLHLRVRVFQIIGYEHVIDHGNALQGLLRLRHKDFPVFPLWMSNIDRNNLATCSFEVSLKPEDVSFVTHEGVGSVKIVEQFDYLGVSSVEILVIDAILHVSALTDADNQIPTILGDAAAKEPLLLIRPLINKGIFRLRRADSVIVKLLKIVCSPQCVALRFVIATVEEPFAVWRPRSIRELHPLNVIRQIVSAGNTAHLPLLPV